MKCKLCNSENVDIFYTQMSKGEKFNYLYCKDCDLYQVNEVYDKVSPEYTQLSDNDIDDTIIWLQGEHKKAAYKKWSSIISKYYNAKKEKLKLLDIGCGTGGFFEFSKNLNLELYGFDASEAQVKYAEQKYPNVKQAISIKEYLKIINKTDLKFDLITLWDVVEHIRNPIELFTEIHHYLAPNGLLFISIPNGGALKKKILLYKLIFKKICLSPWEHVFYYTPASIKHYLNKTGYDIQEIGIVPYYRDKLSLYEIYRRIMHILSSKNINKAPQIYMFAKNVH